MDNKKSAIFKIIIWSLVAVFLTCLFIFLVIFDNFFGSHMFHMGSEKNAKTVRISNVDVADVHSININWTYGSVYVKPYNGNEIIIDEKSNRDLDKDELFEIKETDGVLNLELQKTRVFFNFFSFWNKIKVTEIKLPIKQYNEIKINMTSGKFDISDISVDSLNLKMTSGDINGSNITANYLITHMTSGNMDLKGSFKDINSRATSGDLTIDTTSVPSNLYVDITSGRSSISMPDNDGFVLNKIKTSGIFESDFDLKSNNIYKSGGRNYTVKMTSGKVELLKR